ncbi:MAG TPA: MaoC family dehydratase N-terminal domain-containing protein [Candidatus Udaeobacter sp.]|nr:MaoC family dehydratase N-terminal domain-containing protein [Candidatus Udaeobacter sp.]
MQKLSDATPEMPTGLVGRSRTAEETARVEPLALLAALLEADWPLGAGEPVPPAWHWVYFAPPARQSDLGPDGHEAADDLLPPHRGQARMWAGSRLAFEGNLIIGERLRRRSRVLAVESKSGRSGPFLLVRLEHAIEGEADGRIVEEQDLVYRAPSAPGLQPSGPAPSEPATFERLLVPDPVLLFPFSAATGNPHRIHYDHPYATGVEGYPGLVVHGPLMAILMLDLMHRTRPKERIRRLAFRAERPAFLPDPLAIRGRPCAGGFELWVESAGRRACKMRIDSA